MPSDGPDFRSVAQLAAQRPVTVCYQTTVEGSTSFRYSKPVGIITALRTAIAHCEGVRYVEGRVAILIRNKENTHQGIVPAAVGPAPTSEKTTFVTLTRFDTEGNRETVREFDAGPLSEDVVKEILAFMAEDGGNDRPERCVAIAQIGERSSYVANPVDDKVEPAANENAKIEEKEPKKKPLIPEEYSGTVGTTLPDEDIP